MEVSGATRSARRSNQWLGGEDGAVDRPSGDEILEAFPAARIAALENRRIPQRATRTRLAGEARAAHVAMCGTVGRPLVLQRQLGEWVAASSVMAEAGLILASSAPV